MDSGDFQMWVTGRQGPGNGIRHAFATAQEKPARRLCGGHRGQPRHEVRSRDDRPQRLSQPPAGPGQADTVAGDQVRGLDHCVEITVPAGGHDMLRVEGDHLASRMGHGIMGPPPQQRQAILPGQVVYPLSQDMPTRRDAGCCLGYHVPDYRVPFSMTLPHLDAAMPQPGRSRKFGYLLLAFVALTLASFWLLQRYAVYIARLYDYDIQNPLLQFVLLLLIFALVTAGAGGLAGWLPLRPENQLRLAFGGGVVLAVVVAVYQSRFGMGPDQREMIHRLLKGGNYLAVGLAGAFAGALLLTWRRYGLIEVIARPDQILLDAVREGHRYLLLADTAWDRSRRILEILLSLTAIAIALPISFFLVLAVWLQDPGPVLVAKVVVGRGGGSFNQLKLRSMRKDAEVATGPVPAAPEDGRVTRLGHLLRRTHIDELPQLINIFLGQMSLVGPRPERTVFVARHLNQIKDYAKRHRVRPGLAGLAQVYGDYYSTPREKLHYDLLYIRRRSLGLDARLFLEAVALAILGWDPRRRHRPRPRHRRQDERFRQAYAALRGQDPPEQAGHEADGG